MLLIMIVPITFGGVGIPMEAMNVGLSGALLRRARSQFAPSLLGPNLTRQPRIVNDPFLPLLTLAITKEHFFATSVPYGSIIYREAERNHIPPELVAAVIQAESDFRARLVSEKQRSGLMQIVPSTGRDLGVSDLFNPAENIAAGTKYLRYLLNRFPDQRIALAAYNAGEGVVERCNCIPEYAETRDYVQRVSAHTRNFRHRIVESYFAEMRLEPAR
jgi:soluble lytic murein transglycosylase-like protein